MAEKQEAKPDDTKQEEKEKEKETIKEKEKEREPEKPKLNITEIGRQFINTYYDLYRNDRTKLEIYYRDPSCLSFEGQGFQGTKNIMNKLRNLPIKSIEHDTKTLDVQPSGCGGLMLFITGDLKLDDIKNPVKFSHSFHIVPINA
eukprot:287676_1